MSVANKLKKIRTENSLTQQELATHIGYGQSAIGDIESGKKMPSKEIGIRLASFFKLPLEFFLIDNMQYAPKENTELNDSDRLIAIYDDINQWLKRTHKTMSDSDKLRMALKFYDAGFYKSDNAEQNKQEINLALKVANG